MITQFWGQIETNGSLATNASSGSISSSNNFSPAPTNSNPNGNTPYKKNTTAGQYSLVLDEWIARPPNIIATTTSPNSTNLTGQRSIKTGFRLLDDTQQYQLDFAVFKGTGALDNGFHFSAQTGWNENVTSQQKQNDFEFTLEVINFKDTQVLVPSFRDVTMDRGTVLNIKIPEDATATFRVDKTLSSGGIEWSITAFTNSVGDPAPQPWDEDGSRWKTTITAGPIGTTDPLESFRFVATRGIVISSDPIVRVTTVGS